MHNRIFIEEKKEFSLEELTHLVARAIRSCAGIDIDKDKAVYSRDDVYFTIVDCLGYINERMPGRFKIDQSSFEHYIVRYIPELSDKHSGKSNLLASKAKSAISIYDATGSYPAWATNDEALMALIESMRRQQTQKKSSHIPEHVIENRAHVAIQIREREGKFPEWVDADPRVKAKVESIIDEKSLDVVDSLLNHDSEADDDE